MLLCDRQIVEYLIAQELVVKPILEPTLQIQPTSLDLRLGTSFAIIRNAEFTYLDLLKEPREARREAAKYMQRYDINFNQDFVLHPGEFALASTYEYIRMPSFLSGRLEGKSTWGRLGLLVHSTAGFVDPGFEGALTFELVNVGKAPIKLFPGIRIAQICFYKHEKVLKKYGEGRKHSYSRQVGLQTSLYFEMPDFAKIRRIREVVA
ncbi:MAG: dCTP deaminase [Candidatus Zixiibacteriota bacterium]